MMDEELIYSLHVLDRTARDYGGGGLSQALVQVMQAREIAAPLAAAGGFGPNVVALAPVNRPLRG